MDVISGEWFGAKINWHENLGGGSFGPKQSIATISTPNVEVANFDGDCLVDIAAVDAVGDNLVW